jgi:sigma-E factor negative regulatory protein RseA
MSEIKSESVSSLVDNYSPSADGNLSTHLVDNMLKDEHLSSIWQNYHLIGDVLRDEVPEALQVDLSKNIAAAIAQEATILSPNSSIQTPSDNIEPLIERDAAKSEILMYKNSGVVDAKNRFKAKLSQLVKPMGQVAIAASAAVLMIVGVQQNVADNSPLVTPSQVVQTTPLAGYANPVSFNLQSSQPEQNQQNKRQVQQIVNEKIIAERVAQKRRLQALLKDHNQQVKLGNNIK